MLLAEGSYGNRSTKAGPYRASLYSRSYAAAFTPLQLRSLRAWYDAELGQPKYGGPGAYVQLDGTSGDYIYTPDTATVSFSNDIEVVMRVKVTDWSAAAIQTLVGKYVTTGNQRSWKIASNTSAQIIITVSTDGTTTNTATITPSVALPDNTWIWLRLRMDLTNGSNSVGTVETAADTGTNDEPSSWTANGTATATALAGIFDSTAPLEIGSFNSGTSERLAGQVARCIVRSGFAGTTVADFNASDCYGPGYTHSSGYAWTLGLPKIYDRSGNGVAPATFGAGSNQPLWLPWKGLSGVYVSPAGNRITCAGSSTDVLTGDVEFVAQLDADLWNNPATQGVLFTCTGIEAYHLTSGAIRFRRLVSTVAKNYDVTLPSIPAGKTMWVRGRFDRDNGASASQFTLDVSHSESPSEPSGWTTIGSATNADTGASDTPSGLSLAGYSASQPFAGIVRRFILRNGFGGALVADFDAALCGQSGYTDPAGLTWGVARATSGRKAVVQSPAANSARSVILHGTDDYIDVPNAALPPLGVGDSASIAISCRLHATPTSFGRIFSTEDVTNAQFYIGHQTSGLAYTRMSDGTNSADINSGVSWAITNRSVAVVNIVGRSATGLAVSVNGGSKTTQDNSVVGDATSPDVGRIGARASSVASHSDVSFEALVLRNAATSDVERDLLTAYYKGGL